MLSSTYLWKTSLVNNIVLLSFECDHPFNPLWFPKLHLSGTLLVRITFYNYTHSEYGLSYKSSFPSCLWLKIIKSSANELSKQQTSKSHYEYLNTNTYEQIKFVQVFTISLILLIFLRVWFNCPKIKYLCTVYTFASWLQCVHVCRYIHEKIDGLICKFHAHKPQLLPLMKQNMFFSRAINLF